MRPDNAFSIIDWGNVRVADRRFDLAWTVLLSTTFGTPELQDVIVGEYERQCGEPIADLDFFLAFACLRRLSDFHASLTRGAHGSGMRAEAADLIRQHLDHFRQVYALLRKLTGVRCEELEPLFA